MDMLINGKRGSTKKTTQSITIACPPHLIISVQDVGGLLIIKWDDSQSDPQLVTLFFKGLGFAINNYTKPIILDLPYGLFC